MKTVLKGQEWNDFLIDNDFNNMTQMGGYICTHNYTAIYLLNGYYFCLHILRGYKNLTSLKRLV